MKVLVDYDSINRKKFALIVELLKQMSNRSYNPIVLVEQTGHVGKEIIVIDNNINIIVISNIPIHVLSIDGRVYARLASGIIVELDLKIMDGKCK